MLLHHFLYFIYIKAYVYYIVHISLLCVLTESILHELVQIVEFSFKTLNYKVCVAMHTTNCSR